MSEPKKKFGLENRLVEFACLCLELCDLLPGTKAGNNLEFQLSKSSTASTLNYGEEQAAESKADFLHKKKVVLKEIQELRINLRIMIQKPLVTHEKVHKALDESDQLMDIFLKSIETARNNQKWI